jgi:hypothetical protein
LDERHQPMKFSLFVHMERINARQTHAELYREMV